MALPDDQAILIELIGSNKMNIKLRHVIRSKKGELSWGNGKGDGMIGVDVMAVTLQDCHRVMMIASPDIINTSMFDISDQRYYDRDVIPTLADTLMALTPMSPQTEINKWAGWFIDACCKKNEDCFVAWIEDKKSGLYTLGLIKSEQDQDGMGIGNSDKIKEVTCKTTMLSPDLDILQAMLFLHSDLM